MPQVCHSVEDARTKWCPFARVVVGTINPDGNTVAVNSSQAANNRIDLAPGRFIFPDASNCIADICMAWRWAVTHVRNPEAPDGDLIASHDTHGYCGLAGVPDIAERSSDPTRGRRDD